MLQWRCPQTNPTKGREGVKCACYLLVVRGPDATGDLALQVDLGGPVPLAADRAHQDEAVAVGDQSLGPVVGPGEVAHLRTTRK